MSFKAILKIVLLACLLFVLCIQCIIIFLPNISKHIVHSALGPLPGNRPLDFTVSRMGINQTQISDISFGEDLCLETIRVTYHMDTKKMIGVEKILISGLNVTFHLDEEKKIRVNGLSFPQDKASDHSGSVFDFNISPFKSYFVYLPEHIVLKNSAIFIDTGKDRLCIPVTADIRLDRDKLRADVKLSILPMNQEITFGGTVELLQGRVQMNISSDALYPEVFLAMVPGGEFGRGKFLGPVNFLIETKDFSTFNFEFNDLEIEPDPGLHINFPKISGVLSADKTATALKANGPVQIRSSGVGLEPFRFEFFSQIASGTVEQFFLTFENEITKTWDITPELMGLSMSSINFPDKIQIVDPKFRLLVSGNLEHQAGTLAFSGTGLKSFRKDKANYTDVLDISRLQVKTEFDGNFRRSESFKHIKLDALIHKIAFEKNNMTINTASLNASSETVFTFSNSDIVVDDAIDINVVCNNAKIVTKEISAFARKAGITGKIKKTVSSGIGFQLKPFLHATDIKIKDRGIRASGVYFELPVSYPFNGITASGQAGVKKIVLHNKITPGVSAKIVQTSDLAMDISGKVTRTGFPGLAIHFATRAGLDSAMNPFAKGQMTTNQFSVTQNTLMSFIPGISIVDALAFDISARADFSYTNQKINSSADIHVSNGTLNSVESGFSVSGISADLHFNDLLVPETLPGQYIHIDAFNAGRFNGNNGKIRFSLEDGKSVNIENLKFNWCNGIVSTEAFRLPSKDNAIHLTLYCDRLEMKDLFHQLGAFDAEGGGTLSGRIPVVMKNTEIRFDNGFLFSKPGEGGRIFIRGLDRMLAGIPKHTPEFSQLDLAGEALKNFEYKWVTLHLNTYGDTLAVNMQLDGKPAAALPFEYNRALNSFVRVHAQNPGSNFQGIKLDVNLTLPFNQVLQFGNNLNQIINP